MEISRLTTPTSLFLQLAFVLLMLCVCVGMEFFTIKRMEMTMVIPMTVVSAAPETFTTLHLYVTLELVLLLPIRHCRTDLDERGCPMPPPRPRNKGINIIIGTMRNVSPKYRRVPIFP